MRCDLHVHSRFSGRSNLPLLQYVCDESYSEPEAVYAECRRGGMDLVTITDHDTVAGGLRILGRPDTFLSEEVTCLLPDNRELHVGVYDLSEAQHEKINVRRHDPEALFAYLAEQGLPATLNHPFSALTGHRETADLHQGFEALRLVECQNGMLPSVTNRAATQAARACGRSPIGGSDSHTLRSIATAWTEVPGARNQREFLDGLRRGATIAKGRSGTYARLTSDLASLAVECYVDQVRGARSSLAAAVRFVTLLAAVPVLPLLPVVSAFVFLHEQRFARRHHDLFMRSRAGHGRPGALLGTPAAA